MTAVTVPRVIHAAVVEGEYLRVTHAETGKLRINLGKFFSYVCPYNRPGFIVALEPRLHGSSV